jgi:hypothetical protein
MKPKYIENKNSKFRIGDKVTYIDLKSINREAEIVDFEIAEEWISKLSDGELVHTDYLILVTHNQSLELTGKSQCASDRPE